MHHKHQTQLSLLQDDIAVTVTTLANVLNKLLSIFWITKPIALLLTRSLPSRNMPMFPFDTDSFANAFGFSGFNEMKQVFRST